MSNASFYKLRSKYGGMGVAMLSESIVLACAIFCISETCYRYRPMRNDDNDEIADWLLRLTACHMRWGFGLCFLYMRDVKSHKRLKQDKPEPLAVPERPNETWSVDLMADQLTNDRTFRTFNVLDQP